MSEQRAISISHLGPSLEGHYALAAFVKIWREKGLRVSVGRSFSPDADLCILHHDRTRLNPAVLPAAPAGSRVLNGEILDISKRSYSTLAISAGDAWQGPVIVKTNLNHFGIPERLNARSDLIEKLLNRLARVSWRAARRLPNRSYPVLESIADVPRWVWESSDYIVEKFMPERTDDGLYAVRGWIFFGDKGYAYRMFATDPLVKASALVRHEVFDAPPHELVRFRERMRFDFGKFDYVEHAGAPILLDANKTPTYVGEGETPRVRMLADGIGAFL